MTRSSGTTKAMPRIHGIRERRHQPVFDSLIIDPSVHWIGGTKFDLDNCEYECDLLAESHSRAKQMNVRISFNARAVLGDDGIAVLLDLVDWNSVVLDDQIHLDAASSAVGTWLPPELSVLSNHRLFVADNEQIRRIRTDQGIVITENTIARTTEMISLARNEDE